MIQHEADILVSRQVAKGRTIWPVSTDFCKQNIQLYHNEEDALFDNGQGGGLIATATDTIEQMAGVALVKQLRTAVYSLQPEGELELPRGPGMLISAIRYLDSAGAAQTWSTTNVRLVKSGALPLVVPNPGVSWPTVIDGPGSVEIDYYAGYGDSQLSIPPRWQQAIAAYVAYLWQNRDHSMSNTIFYKPMDLLRTLIDAAGGQVRYA